MATMAMSTTANALKTQGVGFWLSAERKVAPAGRLRRSGSGMRRGPQRTAAMTAHMQSKGEEPPGPHMTAREERGRFTARNGEAPKQVRALQGFLIKNHSKEFRP